jgi:glycosyltransferase involved in cell wall biosynthesis
VIAPLPTSEARPTSRPVRVCFLIDGLTLAGTETQLLALIRSLDRARVRPFLCLLDGEDELSRALEPRGCPVLRLGVRSLHRPAAIGKALRFARFLRQQRIDVLQVYFVDSTYFGVPVGRLAGVRRIVRTWFNTGYCMTPRHRRLGRLCNRLVDALVANCAACRDAFLANEGFRRDRAVVLANGVDLGRFRPPTASRTGRAPRVGVVANLRPVKGLEDFLRAAARVAQRYPEARFEVAGEGEFREPLGRLAGQLGLARRLHLPGQLPDVAGFLADLDVAVLSSHAEGLSNALLEYMAAGKPIVATAVGGNIDLIDDGIHGLLVPPRDPDRLAAAITALLDDPALAWRLGAAARRRVEDGYSRQAMVRRVENFYERLMRR